VTTKGEARRGGERHWFVRSRDRVITTEGSLAIGSGFPGDFSQSHAFGDAYPLGKDFGMSTFKVALAVVALSIALPASAFAGDANQGGSGGSGTNIQSDGAMSGQTTMKSHKKYVKKSTHKKPMNHSM
jgi:hypothetical protein